MVYETLKELFTAICDSVREKDGSVGLIDHQDIPDRILELKSSSGGTAGSGDLREGKSAWVDGELVNGGLPVVSSSVAAFSGDDVSISKGTSNFLFSAKTAKEQIYPADVTVRFEVPLSRFGDAEADNVDYGVTFTSKNGLKLTGKRPVDEGSGTVVAGGAEADSLAELHYWEKSAAADTITEEKVEDYQLSYSNSNGTEMYGFSQYADEIAIVDGALALVNPIARGTIDSETLNGKYIQNGSNFYRIPADATITTNRSTGVMTTITKTVDRAFKLACVPSGSVSIIVSNDSSAYPENGEQNGYTYTYKGTLNDTSSEAIIAALTITENGTYTAPAGVDGYSPITVNVTPEDIPAVEQATPVIEVSASGLITATATQDGGQVVAGTKSATKQLSTQAAKTYTPGKSDQVISSGKYLTGAQTIKGDSNLKSENIKDGVTIFGIKGSYAGDGSQGNGSIEVANLSELHYWTKTDLSSGGPQETLMSSATLLGTVGSTVSYADEITAAGDGLINPQTYTVTKDASAAKELLAGKYVKTTSYLIRIPSEATFRFATLSYLGDSIMVEGAYEITPGSEPEVTLVVNADSAAYPENGERDGYTYVYQGTLSG